FPKASYAFVWFQLLPSAAVSSRFSLSYVKLCDHVVPCRVTAWLRRLPLSFVVPYPSARFNRSVVAGVAGGLAQSTAPVPKRIKNGCSRLLKQVCSVF